MSKNHLGSGAPQKPTARVGDDRHGCVAGHVLNDQLAQLASINGIATNGQSAQKQPMRVGDDRHGCVAGHVLKDQIAHLASMNSGNGNVKAVEKQPMRVGDDRHGCTADPCASKSHLNLLMQASSEHQKAMTDLEHEIMASKL